MSLWLLCLLWVFSCGPALANLPRHDSITYDELNRLKQVTDNRLSGNKNTVYGFDAVGNRTSRSAALGLTAQTVNFDQRDQIDNDAVATTASTYFNANGNTLTYGGTYTYDWANRLLTQASPSVTLTYDGDGNRIKKVVGSTTTWYLVATVNPSGYPQVVEELTGTTPSTLSRVYSYGLDLACQRTISGSVVRYFGYDGLGSTKFLLDPAGAVTDTYTYDAYGTLIASTVSTANNYRYAGEQWDADLGMYYLRARYLNPNLGRFQTRDTFEGNQTDPLSLHKFLYAHANPVDRLDPSGHDATAGTLPGLLGGLGGRGILEGIRLPAISMARARALAKISAAATALATTLTGDSSNPNRNAMRLQLQQGEQHYWSLPMFAPSNVGVTSVQVRAGLGAMHAAAFGDTMLLPFPNSLEPQLYTAIILFSQRLTPIVAGGGVTQGGNVLREEFISNGRLFRIDLENLRGHNLRR